VSSAIKKGINRGENGVLSGENGGKKGENGGFSGKIREKNRLPRRSLDEGGKRPVLRSICEDGSKDLGVVKRRRENKLFQFFRGSLPVKCLFIAKKTIIISSPFANIFPSLNCKCLCRK
jgi:hypothetical protein